jgi:hypothetical protein
MDKSIGHTRIWWDGREVNFIRWTNGTLVFAWRETDETAMHIPRGAVTRLIDRGVLEVAGDLPEWLNNKLSLKQPEDQTPSQPALSPRPQPAPQANKRSIIVRLLAKLGGDPSRVQARS